MAVDESRELHVLAVDDSLVDRKVIERLLKISSCKVTAVESGRRALQYLGLDGDKDSVALDDMKVNMIITDYSMPGMNGYELLKKIKGSSKLREIPVVVMSSENVLANIDRCLEGGAEEFLVKPVKLADVQRLRDFVLNGEEKSTEKKAPSCKRKTHEELSFLVPTMGSPQSPLDCNVSSPPTPVPVADQPVEKRQRISQDD